MDRRTYLASVAGATAAGLAGCLGIGGSDGSTGTDGTAGTTGTAPTTTADGSTVAAETVATGLEVPWGAAYRDGTLYLTERPGRVVRIVDGEREVVAEFSDTRTGGEGGLLGLVFHPEDPDVACTYQTYSAGQSRANRIRRHDVTDGWRPETVFDDIPGASVHDGGRLFVWDGALYATTGDAREADHAQDTTRLHGKVLRLTLDGDPHPDNPFDGGVFTYGHRNPQGLAVRDGELYATEHGPDTDDEINRLEAGGNYGWPVVRGPSDREAFVDPLTSYTPTIAPGGAVFYPDDGPIADWRGDLFFGTLAGRHLHRARIEGGEVVEDERLFEGRFGRLRTTFLGPDGHLHAVTSNRDGRGRPNDGDDRVLRFVPR
ncbi:PQQ-dependent sugar dehydrogenase [Halomarina litorea]|uniref:PQQ-dependent sugar dehydrogenase n=1 Tax=Halomarina litorea TaxID=2961595 RepID=UPI0020C2EF2A|nr:PQQ-dependent sugar dehydrogenase [Halomarina sp. BCD28]